MSELKLPSSAQIDLMIEALQRPKNVIIGKRTLTVTAGTFEKIMSRDIDISDYPIQYATVTTDAEHAFRMSFMYKIENRNNQMNVIDGTYLYTNTEWIDAKSNSFNAYISNADGIDHEYRVTLYGIR